MLVHVLNRFFFPGDPRTLSVYSWWPLLLKRLGLQRARKERREEGSWKQAMFVVIVVIALTASLSPSLRHGGVVFIHFWHLGPIEVMELPTACEDEYGRCQWEDAL